MSTVSRLLEFLSHKDIGKGEFYRRTGISNGYLDKVKELGTEKAEIILNEFPDLNIYWLILGTGKMINDTPMRQLPKGTAIERRMKLKDPAVPYFTRTIDDTVVALPMLDLQFAAGASAYTPDYLESVEFMYLPKRILKNGRTYACGRVKGHSMAPTLLDSGYVILRLLEKQEWQNMPNEDIYVVVSPDGSHANAQIKRVKNRFNKGFITLMSDNPDKASFPNFNLMEDEIISIWHQEFYLTARTPNIHNQYYSRLQALEDKVDDLINDFKPIKKH